MKTSDNGKPAVMIVDDSEIDIDILAECLGDDYRIRVATDSPTALEDIFQKPPDIILLDIMMPLINGYDICKRLKQDDKTKDIPIIFVTSLNEPVDEAMGFELGAVDYINKPFSFSVVRARLKTHLDLAYARKELRLRNKILKENLELRELIEQMTHHDLKNPLQTIMNEAGILMIGNEFKSKHDNLRIIIKSCYTINDMINKSSDLYKMEKGQYKPRLEKMDILPIMDRVLAGVKNIIDSKKLEIEFAINDKLRIPSHQFEILCDNLLFYSMMSNLVKNAVAASPEKGVVRLFFNKNSIVSFGVQNQGVVRHEIRDKFFDKFITAGKLDGTGLGTYSAQLMAKVQGGNIQFYTSDADDKTVLLINWFN